MSTPICHWQRDTASGVWIWSCNALPPSDAGCAHVAGISRIAAVGHIAGTPLEGEGPTTFDTDDGPTTFKSLPKGDPAP